MLEISVLAKLLIYDVKHLLVLQPVVDHLAGLLSANKFLLIDYEPVLLHEGELHQTQSVDIVPAAVMLQEPLPVLVYLTNQKSVIRQLTNGRQLSSSASSAMSQNSS